MICRIIVLNEEMVTDIQEPEAVPQEQGLIYRVVFVAFPCPVSSPDWGVTVLRGFSAVLVSQYKYTLDTSQLKYIVWRTLGDAYVQQWPALG